MRLNKNIATIVAVLLGLQAVGQQTELNSGWQAQRVNLVKAEGKTISSTNYKLTNWLPATVPGTVLTTLINNKKMPDPFYGMNNNKIPDVYHVGRDYYTYWFAKDLDVTHPSGDKQVYLRFRGVNYGCDFYLNGQKLNATTEKGMFIEHEFNITKYLNKDGHNRLAVKVTPPDALGNPNGGQGGDGEIARNVAHQYVAGWDWIQPIRDRNTGIWDKVFVVETGAVIIEEPHFITKVPGKRFVEGAQAPATLQSTVVLKNATDKVQTGTLRLSFDGQQIDKNVQLASGQTLQLNLADVIVQNPKLWWPNTYGPQNLYKATIQFIAADGAVLDVFNQEIGIRELSAYWNEHTRSKEIAVNGQKIFIKGGNWVISDELLRFSDARYNAEVRFHHDMNLNTIRVWGGAITERPEFYEACDKYGMLVMQDFWGSGDCNGRWVDPLKLEDQWTRRGYPDDHALFVNSAAQQIKLIRNYPSLAFWCGGNEIMLPEDIHHALKDSLMPLLDDTRWFVDYSNSDSMSYNSLGGNGDGPYGIQDVKTFWNFRTWPFNTEVGSVGVGDYTSLKRFLPKENLVIPVDIPGSEAVKDSVWTYHKYISYGNSIDQYGKAKDLEDFANKAQLVNYEQYRALIEGFTSHQWDWYTGIMIWKTQNPWTALRGQMYDYYLDPNACLYGLRKGGELMHTMFNPSDSSLWIVNNGFTTQRSIMTSVRFYDVNGKEKLATQLFSELVPSNSKKIMSLAGYLQNPNHQYAFMTLRLEDAHKKLISENTYWLADKNNSYAYLMQMPRAKPTISIQQIAANKIQVAITVPANTPTAFFNRLSVVDAKSGERLLPTFYSDNYVTVVPGSTQTIDIEYPASKAVSLEVEGVNFPTQKLKINS